MYAADAEEVMKSILEAALVEFRGDGNNDFFLLHNVTGFRAVYMILTGQHYLGQHYLGQHFLGRHYFVRTLLRPTATSAEHYSCQHDGNDFFLLHNVTGFRAVYMILTGQHYLGQHYLGQHCLGRHYLGQTLLRPNTT